MKYSVGGIGIAAVAVLLCQLQAEATTIEVARNQQRTAGDTGTAPTLQSQPGRLAQAVPPSGQSQQAQPAQAAPKIPTRTEILTFDGWVVTCNEFESPKSRVCSALLQIQQQNNGQVVFSWTVALDGNKQVHAVM